MASSSYSVRHKERQAERAASSRVARRPSSASLATVLAQQPASFDGKKIAAVDKCIASLDALPERYSAIKTLYVSKNNLRSLAGIEQFRGLRALSAADNALADLDCLRLLPAAGISLEAASFEGNPMADLPNYRAHAIHILGPSLAMLDNRPVSEEERRSAAGAVAHEATVLALMTSNACLVHKLGRAVQLVRLHCELQCAVLGGQYGTTAAVAGDGLPQGGGQGISRVLQMWDYEGRLGRQERHAIGLAIRKEVGKRYRKLVLSGGRPEGSAKLWQQAFAQVMLLQQETIASLMGKLEAAKEECAATLAPITRPASPTKLRALQSEQAAQGRVRQDREALIQELRDAFLGLADSASHANAQQRAAQYEARIQELHAALEAACASGSGSPGGAAHARAPKGQVHQEELSPVSKGQWAIPAVRPPPGTRPSAAPAATPTRAAVQQGGGKLRSALKQLRPASEPREPRPTSARFTGSRPAALEGQDDPSAALRPGTAPASKQQQGAAEAQRPWQPDDGLAEYEGMEQARCKTPRPFRGTQQQPSRAVAQEPSGTGQLAGRPQQAGRELSGHLEPGQAPLAGGGDASSRPASRNSSPERSRPPSPARSLPGSPSTQWLSNPVARHSNEGDTSPRVASPQQGGGGLQSILELLQREGRVKQVAALQCVVAQHETAAAELQAANHQLAQALQEVQQHARRLEEQLADQRAAAEQAQASAAAQDERQAWQLEELRRQLESVLASKAALSAELEALLASQRKLEEQALAEREQAVAEWQRLAELAQAEREAAAAQAARLQARVAELEGRKVVELRLAVVSHEEEWRREAVRAAALEARAGELQAQVAAFQRQQRLEAACSALASRAILRRAVLRWQEAAAECAHLRTLGQAAMALHRRTLLFAWLGRLQLAIQRSKLLAVRAQQRQTRGMQQAWQAWRAYCQECVLQRGLHAAADMHQQSAVLRRCFSAWGGQVAACRQVELPAHHPTMRAAARLQRRCLLGSFFGAWRQYIVESVLPRMAQVQMRLLEQWMGSQRRAFLAWQQYLQYRRRARMLKAIAGQHFLRQQLLRWQQAADEARQERTALVRGALSSRALLLRRAWRAWHQGLQQRRLRMQQRVMAAQQLRRKLLLACWQGWQEWTLLCHGVAQRSAARRQAAVLRAWRAAVKAAERKRLADAFRMRCCQLQFRASLAAWRAAVACRRQRRCQAAHARQLLQRRRLGRVVAEWRRAALAGRLNATLGLVSQLQGAVERVRQELECKAEEVDALQLVRVEVQGQSEHLSLQVDCLDADLATAQRQVAQLQQAAHAAQEQHQAAAEALERAVAAQAAAEAAQAAAEAERSSALAERDAAVAARQQAEADREAASAAREEAQQAAEEAGSKADAAATAAAAALARAAAATEALQELLQEHRQAQQQLQQVREERQTLRRDLDAALCEVQRTAGLLEGLREDCTRLQRKREEAEQRAALAAAEQQAALKQAERLAALCEEREQQCVQLQAQAVQLQAGQSAAQEELAAVAERSRQLQADQASMAAQLERFAGAVRRGEQEQARLQQAVDDLRAERESLCGRAEEAEAEARQLASLADRLRDAKSELEGQLASVQAEASHLADDQRVAAAAAACLQEERDGLAASVRQLQEGKAGLEASVCRLRDQLQQSNAVLDSCRKMLGECCSAKAAADDQAVSVTELLRSVQAEQLLKEASIKALTRENAQRGERLRALQAQVETLSRQVAASGRGSPSSGTPLHSQLPCGRGAMPAGSGTSSWSSAGGSAAHAGTAAPAPAAPTTASGSAASGGSAGAQLRLQREGGTGVPTPCSPSLAACSPSLSFIPMPAGQLHAAESAAKYLISAQAASSSLTVSLNGGQPPPALSQHMQARLLSPGRHASDASPAPLAPALSDQRLSYLLHMVVEKQISAGQAQQVINSAAEGDARPLLHVLDSARRRVGASPCAQLEPMPAPPPAAGPVPESELAAVRLQLQHHLRQQQEQH